jgi:hypothetical protein
MVRIVRQFLTTLFPHMPTTLDFRIFSGKDFIGYLPVLEKSDDPVPVSDSLSVKHFVIMEDADGCSFYLTPNYAMSFISIRMTPQSGYSSGQSGQRRDGGGGYHPHLRMA